MELVPEFPELDVFVVFFPLGIVAEDLVCLLHALELILLDGLQVRVLYLVWVALEDELPVGRLDGAEVCILIYTECFVWVWW